MHIPGLTVIYSAVGFIPKVKKNDVIFNHYGTTFLSGYITAIWAVG